MKFLFTITLLLFSHLLTSCYFPPTQRGFIEEENGSIGMNIDRITGSTWKWRKEKISQNRYRYIITRPNGCTYEKITDAQGTILSWNYISDPRTCKDNGGFIQFN